MSYSDLKEGDVVLVLGKLDDRVRENSKNGIVEGTVVSVTKDKVVVLLTNSDLWHGLKREVVLYSEHMSE